MAEIEIKPLVRGFLKRVTVFSYFWSFVGYMGTRESYFFAHRIGTHEIKLVNRIYLITRLRFEAKCITRFKILGVCESCSSTLYQINRKICDLVRWLQCPTAV